MTISNSEQLLLEILWSESPLTVGQIIERIQLKTQWHQNTIKTMLTRLIKKGTVKRNRDGKRFFYAPNVSRYDILSKETEGFLSRFFGGEIAPLVANFAKNKKLSKKELDDIETILNKLKDGNG